MKKINFYFIICNRYIEYTQVDAYRYLGTMLTKVWTSEKIDRNRIAIAKGNSNRIAVAKRILLNRKYLDLRKNTVEEFYMDCFTLWSDTYDEEKE